MNSKTKSAPKKRVMRTIQDTPLEGTVSREAIREAIRWVKSQENGGAAVKPEKRPLAKG